MKKLFAPAAFLAAFMAVATLAGEARAHGGVSVEDDVCIMRVGPYRAHFTGYQPKQRASQEFCEDIPELAPAIIVLDFVDDALRAMEIEFRILKDVNNIGIYATYPDLGSQADIDAATVFDKSPAIYPRGSVDMTMPFTEAGAYIGLLIAKDPNLEKTYISVFPFSVDVTDWWKTLRWIIAALLLGAIFFFGSAAYQKAGRNR